MKHEIKREILESLTLEGEFDHKVSAVDMEELDKVADTSMTGGLRSVFLAHLDSTIVLNRALTELGSHPTSGISATESAVTPETAQIYEAIRTAVDSHGMIQTLIANGAPEDSINEARAAVVVQAFSVTSE